MTHYNRIARELAEDPGAYAPVLEVDPNGGDLLWCAWINGFERAMRLRADAWEALAFGDDEDAAASVSMILAMNAWDHGEAELNDDDEDRIEELAPSPVRPTCACTTSIGRWLGWARSSNRPGTTISRLAA